jgi:integrase
MACKKAGVPNRIPHDFRRTAARNPIRAGVPERIATTILGPRRARSSTAWKQALTPKVGDALSWAVTLKAQ